MTSAPTFERQGVEFFARNFPKGLELGLRNYWYPVLRSEDLTSGKIVPFKALNEELVAWRNDRNEPCVVADRCPHRGARFSLGRVLAGDLQCALHGLRFDKAGRCTLIPWEPDSSPLLEQAAVTAYPSRELGGWIWAYLGDPKEFPVPRLEDVVPEELVNPDAFIVFRHPIDIWKCNWLQALDGSDGYHAVMLHSESQPVESKEYTGGPLQRPSIPLEDRRVKIVDTPQGLRGIAYQPGGEELHHGHFTKGWKGERWTLPCLFSLPLKPAPNLPAYVARLYQFPVDATHTQNSRWVAMRAENDAQREECWRLYEAVIGPRQRTVMQEDKVITESIGDVVETRLGEHLFAADRDVVRVRKMMSDAWISQKSGERPLHRPEAMVFPV